jgi:SAM-dependent methyltransferase
MVRRFSDEGLRNVHVVQGGLEDLPVASGTVDLAVLSGVFSRLGETEAGGRHRERQVKLLREVRKTLKPSGLVYLGVENRWSLRSAGRRRATLCSTRGYRKLLKVAGYADVRIWCALPSHDDPHFIVHCTQVAFDHFLRAFVPPPANVVTRLLWNTLNALRVLKYTTNSYCILAKREPGVIDA